MTGIRNGESQLPLPQQLAGRDLADLLAVRL